MDRLDPDAPRTAVRDVFSWRLRACRPPTLVRLDAKDQAAVCNAEESSAGRGRVGRAISVMPGGLTGLGGIRRNWTQYGPAGELLQRECEAKEYPEEHKAESTSVVSDSAAPGRTRTCDRRTGSPAWPNVFGVLGTAARSQNAPETARCAHAPKCARSYTFLPPILPPIRDEVRFNDLPDQRSARASGVGPPPLWRRWR